MPNERIQEKANAGSAIPACVSGWLVPGLGHVMIGRRVKGLIFFLVIMSLFGVGLYLQGELFPFRTNELLTMLAGLAEIGVGLPYFVVDLMKMGRGSVTSPTYEYGYTFLIVAGLIIGRRNTICISAFRVFCCQRAITAVEPVCERQVDLLADIEGDGCN